MAAPRTLEVDHSVCLRCHDVQAPLLVLHRAAQGCSRAGAWAHCWCRTSSWQKAGPRRQRQLQRETFVRAPTLRNRFLVTTPCTPASAAACRQRLGKRWSGWRRWRRRRQATAAPAPNFMAHLHLWHVKELLCCRLHREGSGGGGSVSPALRRSSPRRADGAHRYQAPGAWR